MHAWWWITFAIFLVLNDLLPTELIFMILESRNQEISPQRKKFTAKGRHFMQSERCIIIIIYTKFFWFITWSMNKWMFLLFVVKILTFHYDPWRSEIMHFWHLSFLKILLIQAIFLGQNRKEKNYIHPGPNFSGNVSNIFDCTISQLVVHNTE